MLLVLSLFFQLPDTVSYHLTRVFDLIERVMKKQTTILHPNDDYNVFRQCATILNMSDSQVKRQVLIVWKKQGLAS